MMRRLFKETVPAYQMVLPFDMGKPSVAQHNTELINLSWPKEQLLGARWPEGSRLGKLELRHRKPETSSTLHCSFVRI